MTTATAKTATAPVVTPNPWIGGPIEINCTPSATDQSVLVAVTLEGTAIASGKLTQENPNLPLNFSSGNDSISGTLSVQFATPGQINILMAAKLTAQTLTQSFPSFSGQICTWPAS